MRSKMSWKRAESLLRNNRLPEARNLCIQICNESPANYKAWKILGDVLLREDNHMGAVNALQQAANLKPDTDTLYKLAKSQQALGNTHEARSTLHRLLNIDQNHAEAWFALGLIQGQLNIHEQAAFCYQQTIRLQPDHFLAHACLGNTLFMQGQMESAITSYRLAVRIRPDNITAYCNLGMALSSISHHNEAIACFRKALEIKPDAAKIHIVMANTLTATGVYEEALASYRKAAELDPDCIDAIAGEAGSLEKLGQYDAAKSRIDPLIANNNITANIAVAYSSISKHFHEEEKACAVIEDLVKEDYLSAMQRLSLHFAAGELLDRLGKYDAAFSHFDKANRLSPLTTYNTDIDRQSFDTIINSYSKQKMEQAPRSLNTSEKPVFIIGMPRSGTSLVEQILSSHPQVFGAGELGNIQAIVNNITDADYLHTIPHLSQQTLNSISQTHLSFLEGLAPDAMRIIDKMPHNFLHIGLIYLLFPNARIIHCTRHPLDTCLSIYIQYFANGNDYSYRQESLGEHYCNYRRLMQHWQSLGIPMLDVSYEALVSDREKVSRQIVEYCGLEWDDRCLLFHQSRRITRTASYEQVRNPIHSRSVNRWKNYEDHLKPLIEILQKAGIFNIRGCTAPWLESFVSH